MNNENNTINVLKFICSIFIIGLHCYPLFINERINYYSTQYLFRFCVPFFFIVTGYYFNKMSNTKRKSYIIRIMILYLLSTVLYLPLIIKQSYSSKLIITFLIFGYHHLWYIVSLFITLTILYLIYKNKDFKSSKCVIATIVILIIIGSYLDEYYKIFNISQLSKVYVFSTTYLFGGRNFILFTLPMVLIGMCLESNESKIKKISLKKNSLLVIISFIVFLFETYYLRHKIPTIISNDITLFNCLPAISLFMICLNINIHIKNNTKPLRKISDIMYIIHPYIIYYITSILHLYNFKLFIISFSITIIISIIIYLTKKLLRLS